MIKENTFAAACYDTLSLHELYQALKDGPDDADMMELNLSREEWLNQITLAIEERIAA